MNEKEMSKLLSQISDLKVSCKHCGHRVHFTNRKDRIICNYCGRFIYKDDKVEFQYKMKELRNGRTK